MTPVELADVLVRLDHVARFIVNPDHSIDHSIGFNASPTRPKYAGRW